MTSYILALWLLGVFISRIVVQIYLGDGGVASLGIQIFAIIWPLSIFLFLSGGIFPKKLNGGTVSVISIFMLTASVSCFVSPIQLYSIGYLIATMSGIYIALLFNSHLKADDFLAGFKWFSVFAALLLIAYIKYDYRTFPGYRLGMGTETMNPNSIAMIVMSCGVAAFAFKSYLLRIFVLSVVITTIFLAGSRAAAVATILSLIIVSWSDIKRSSMLTRVMVITPILLGGIIFVALNSEIVLDKLNSFFLWNDEHRGIASGGSGRTLVWAKMFDIISQNWLLGVGYRAHQEFIGASSAHNGYLALLAEIGLLGFSTILLYIITKGMQFMLLYFKTNSRLISVYFSFFVGFTALAMFERYLINVGNPASLMFLLILFVSKSQLREMIGNHNAR